MFPYNYKRKNSNSGLNLKFRNVSERVKSQYLNTYRAIVRLVLENHYEVPRCYSRNDWKRVMIELQCAAFVRLRKDVSMGNLSIDDVSDDRLWLRGVLRQLREESFDFDFHLFRIGCTCGATSTRSEYDCFRNEE